MANIHRTSYIVTLMKALFAVWFIYLIYQITVGGFNIGKVIESFTN